MTIYDLLNLVSNISLDDALQAAILFSGVMGQLCVAHKNINAFYWYNVCNLLLFYVSVEAAQYGMAALYVFYTCMCFYSIRQWKQDSINFNQEIKFQPRRAIH